MDVVSAAVSGPPAAPSVAAPGGRAGGRTSKVSLPVHGAAPLLADRTCLVRADVPPAGFWPQDTGCLLLPAGATLQDDVPPVPAKRGPVAASPSAACRRLSSQASCSPRSALDVRTVSRRHGSLSAQAVGKHGASLNQHETGVLRARRQPAGTGQGWRDHSFPTAVRAWGCLHQSARDTGQDAGPSAVRDVAWTLQGGPEPGAVPCSPEGTVT